jgi:hypothetical protein
MPKSFPPDTSKKEMWLTILVIVGYIAAAFDLNYDLLPGYSWLCFFWLSVGFILIETLAKPRPVFKNTSQPLIASSNARFNVRLKNNVPGTVTVTFEWSNRPDNAYIQQRIFNRASSAVAQFFSTLTDAPGFPEVMTCIIDATKREVRSLGLAPFDVMIQGIEINEQRKDDRDHGSVFGEIRFRAHNS